MRIVNKTRGTAIASGATAARTFRHGLVGLLGKRSLAPGEGLVIEPCQSVDPALHFAIDAVYIDRALRVVKVVHDYETLSR